MNARKLNMSGAFMVPEAQEIKVRGRSVLQIDDVHTSGAAVKAASGALLRGGASKVDVLAFSRALTKELRFDGVVPQRSGLFALIFMPI